MRLLLLALVLSGCGRELQTCNLSLSNEQVVQTTKCPLNTILTGYDGTVLYCSTVTIACPVGGKE